MVLCYTLGIMRKMYKLLGRNGMYESESPGQLGVHKKQKIYGRLNCKTALRAIEKSGYVSNRVFFVDEQMAIECGYCPRTVCMPVEYSEWLDSTKEVWD